MPNKEITVKGVGIRYSTVNQVNYICLTDMIKAKDGDFFITDWLRNRNTLEYIGIWESIYNPNFNYGEFAIIKSKAGLNNFKISVNEFVERTGAISLQAKAGRYGGTYAHEDIAFEFGMRPSPPSNKNILIYRIGCRKWTNFPFYDSLFFVDKLF